MGRLDDNWKEGKRFLPILSGEDEGFKKLFDEKTNRINRDNYEGHGFAWEIMNNCQEIVLGYEEKVGYCLNLVLRSIDMKTFEIIVEAALQMQCGEDINKVRDIIGIAMIKDVPVFGDTIELHENLKDIQSSIIKEGFTSFFDGEEKRVKITRFNDFDLNNSKEILKNLSCSHLITPGEIRIVNEKISSDFRQYANAAKFIDSLHLVIKEFSELLKSKTRNENQLQEYITRNPILFGTEYKSIKPKHCLGSEYEMDYALQRFDGIFDLVELESSSLGLYTKDGNPRAELTHAEQQILDWQEWLEEKNFYAREYLKDIRSPKGFVVLGRSESLNDDLKKKLARRNLTFGNKLQVLTYDDLLNKVETFLEIIKKSN